jgi:hypothetical protein
MPLETATVEGRHGPPSHGPAPPARLALLLAAGLVALCCPACQRGKRFYPVRGQVLADGKPAKGVMVIFHPLDDPDPHPVQPSAVVQEDGSFALRSYLVGQRVLKEGAPAGQYLVTCTWYPPDLEKYLGMENLPDKLRGRYANPKTSGLRAEVPEGPTELPAFRLEVQDR